MALGAMLKLCVKENVRPRIVCVDNTTINTHLCTCNFLFTQTVSTLFSQPHKHIYMTIFSVITCKRKKNREFNGLFIDFIPYHHLNLFGRLYLFIFIIIGVGSIFSSDHFLLLLLSLLYMMTCVACSFAFGLFFPYRCLLCCFRLQRQNS